MTTPASTTLAIAILEIHCPWEIAVPGKGLVRVCEHCHGLCHSREGLACDTPADAVYPCETAKLILDKFPALANEVEVKSL